MFETKKEANRLILFLGDLAHTKPRVEGKLFAPTWNGCCQYHGLRVQSVSYSNAPCISGSIYS